MRKLLMAATASFAVATPALAAAQGPYVGIEGGVTFPRSSDLDVILNNTTTYDNGYRLKYKDGIDVDAIAGYKLGPIRLEAEGGYKRAKVKSLGVSTPLVTDVGTAAGTTATADDFSAGNRIGVKTLMANALLDSNFGNSRFGGYVGGGAGRAWASMSGDKDSAWAYQGIAGLRYAVSPNVDAGVKYRYFRTGALGFDDTFAVNNVPFTTETSGHYSSHSVLASLAYNFNGRAAAAPEPEAPPPPPPAPEAPATQTCADGSVILATGTCPVPPPPPPPPAPATGERGR